MSSAGDRERQLAEAIASFATSVANGAIAIRHAAEALALAIAEEEIAATFDRDLGRDADPDGSEWKPYEPAPSVELFQGKPEEPLVRSFYEVECKCGDGYTTRLGAFHPTPAGWTCKTCEKFIPRTLAIPGGLPAGTFSPQAAHAEAHNEEEGREEEHPPQARDTSRH
tara:strand:- start:22060 stop:22563 length:504 start_codon:yes stop_codon:yes gene_type:complete